MKKPKRLKLKEWAALEGRRKKIRKYAQMKFYNHVADEIVAITGYGKKPWYVAAKAYTELQLANLPRVKFPIMSGDGDGEDAPWDYDGRNWYWWLNLFASKYGWGEAEVSQLDIDDAIGLYQEIVVDEQLEREWQHGHSETAYEYVPSTKKTKLVQIPRPKFMLATKENYKKKPIKKTKILKSMLPVGNIINLDEEDADELNLKESEDANTSPNTP